MKKKRKPNTLKGEINTVGDLVKAIKNGFNQDDMVLMITMSVCPRDAELDVENNTTKPGFSLNISTNSIKDLKEWRDKQEKEKKDEQEKDSASGESEDR